MQGARPLRVALAALAVAVLGAACASTGYHYVKNSDDRTYFKVPDGWKLYDQEAILKRSDLSPQQKETARDMSWQVNFDASPKPSLKHVLSPDAKQPSGLASVDELSFDDADGISLGALRNAYVDVDGAVQNDAGKIITYEPLERDGGFHGFHLVVDLVTESGRTVTLDQTTLLDQSTSKLYMLLVSCEAQCYEDNSEQIGHVVDSWTVRE